MRQDSEQFIPHGSFLEPWAFVAQGVTGAAIERPLERVAENPARSCSYEPNSTKATSSQVSYIDYAQDKL